MLRAPLVSARLVLRAPLVSARLVLCTPLVSALLVGLGALVSACVPTWPPPGGWGCASDGCEDTEGSSSSGMPEPTSGTDTSAMPTTGADVPGTSTGAPHETTTASSTGVVDETPQIISVEMKPLLLGQLGHIIVDVSAKFTDTVTMQIHTGDLLALESLGDGMFRGAIPIYSSVWNGLHQAVLEPLLGGASGEVVLADYGIALPTAGGQRWWKLANLPGHTVALAPLPGEEGVVALLTTFEMGEPRCVLWKLAGDGSSGPADFVPLLPDGICRGVALKRDPDTGALYVLGERETNGQKFWWLVEISTWGKGPKTLAMGELGETAFGLALRKGQVAVCGSKVMPTLDLDVYVSLHSPGVPFAVRTFDNPNELLHTFHDTARGCAFSGDTLVLVGETHEKTMGPAPDTRILVEYDTITDTTIWTVGGPGPGTQSRAVAVAVAVVDGEPRYLVPGTTCGDICKPDGEVRFYRPGGDFEGQIPLGPLGPVAVEPGGIDWSPARYMLIPGADESGDQPRFRLRAFDLEDAEELWSFFPTDADGLQIATTVASGEIGQIYVGGIGQNNRPVVAKVDG